MDRARRAGTPRSLSPYPGRGGSARRRRPLGRAAEVAWPVSTLVVSEVQTGGASARPTSSSRSRTRARDRCARMDRARLLPAAGRLEVNAYNRGQPCQVVQQREHAPHTRVLPSCARPSARVRRGLDRHAGARHRRERGDVQHPAVGAAPPRSQCSMPIALVMLWSQSTHARASRRRGELQRTTRLEGPDHDARGRGDLRLDPWSYRIAGVGDPFDVSYSSVSGTFFDTLGAAPLIGRTLRQDDDRWDGARRLVLSEGLWRRRFNADPLSCRTHHHARRRREGGPRRHCRRDARGVRLSARGRRSWADDRRRSWAPSSGRTSNHPSQFIEYLARLLRHWPPQARDVARRRDGRPRSDLAGAERGSHLSGRERARGADAARRLHFRQRAARPLRADGRGRPGAAHRLRQRRQPAPRARRRARARGRSARRARREPLPDRAVNCSPTAP